MSLFIDLVRTYEKDWTTGLISINSVVLSYSIELPWRENQRNISCIPEGIYEVEIRHSKRFKRHIWIRNVINRKWILLHPANDASRELRGCIAPVLKLLPGGKGSYSCLALNLIIKNILRHPKKKVFLRISS